MKQNHCQGFSKACGTERQPSQRQEAAVLQLSRKIGLNPTDTLLTNSLSDTYEEREKFHDFLQIYAKPQNFL